MHGLIRADLVRSAFDDHAAVVHHRHALRDAERDVHVVLDEDQRDRGVEPQQELGEKDALAAREARRGLVEHQHAGLGGERHRDRDLPVLAVREVTHALAQLVVDRDAVRGLPRPLASLGIAAEDHRSHATALHADDRQVDAVLDRQPEEMPRLLVRPREPELHARPGGAPGDVLAVELDRSARDRHVAADEVEERCLARAVRPEHRAALALRDVEVDVPHGEQTTETPADPPQAEGRRGTCVGDGLSPVPHEGIRVGDGPKPVPHAVFVLGHCLT